MNRFFSSFLVLCAIYCWTSECHAQWNILPLGNSITQAQTPQNSYRRDLWNLFQSAGISVDFVGSFDEPENCGTYPDASFDHDHEGHWGYFVRQIVSEPSNPLNCRSGTAGEGLGEWLKGYTPDIVLMHLGTNNMIYGEQVSATLDEIEDVIDLLRGDNPNVVIFMAQLIPTRRTNDNIKIDSLNDAIPAFASSLTTTESPIIVVDQHTGYDASTDNYDNFHPNTSGEAKMAQNWFNAVNSYVNTTFPVVWGDIVAESSPNGVQLRWETQREENNSHFEIEYRPVNQSRDFQRVATVAARGGVSMTQYEAWLTNLTTGTHLLRIKQVDLDGSFDYSSLVQVEVKESQRPFLAYHQTDQYLVIRHEAFGPNADATYHIKNSLGQDVRQGHCIEYNGVPTIPIHGLPHGVYVSTIQTDEGTVGTLRFIVRTY